MGFPDGSTCLSLLSVGYINIANHLTENSTAFLGSQERCFLFHCLLGKNVTAGRRSWWY